MLGRINSVLKRFHYTLKKDDPFENSKDIFHDTEFMRIYDSVREFTMTSPERLYSLYKSVEYVLDNNIPGDFVECGVWRGGSAMTMAMILKRQQVTNRRIFLYDTFEGMPEPTENDNDIYGNRAEVLLSEAPRKSEEKNVWCLASLEDVKQNLGATGYPTGNLIFVKGKIEETIPATIPSEIALLRLDTDWYESTWHELNYLYPILSSKGVLIIDDYGHWQGARKAVDDYITSNKLSLLLHRVDYTARCAIKY